MTWNNNAVQFPRLLCEIMATQELDMETLAEAMDLSIEDVNALFDRADQAWENIKSGAEVLPGATAAEVREIQMQDVVGDYDTPDRVPEWAWIAANACFQHIHNGQDGVWEFVLNLSCTFSEVPETLKPVLAAAYRDQISYLIFHQGT